VKQYQKTLVVWLVFILVFAAILSVLARTGEKSTNKKFSEVIAAIETGDVKEVTIKGQAFSGTFKSNAKFQSTGVLSDSVLEVLRSAQKEHQTQYIIEKEDPGTFWIFLVQWLPMLVVIVLVIMFMRQLQAGGGKAMSFGKSRARMLTENQNKVTFDDVAGAEESKAELAEIVEFLKDPKKFTRLGGRIPKGVLLMGPPGTGKTLLARAIAGEAGVPFFSIAGSDFVEMFVGVGASRVRDLFEQGKKNAPCIIFIDEIDAVGRHRGAGMGGGHDEREQTLNQLLVEMDGFEANEGVIIIAATNRPDVLDPAILRPGRFDRRVVVPRPDLLGREAIFGVHTRKVPISDDVDMEVLARATPGMSGADIENLVNEAALEAARRNRSKVTMIDFEMAREKVMMGAERRSMVMSEKDLKNTAYHESGHAIVSLCVEGESDPVHKVTIIPRGRALGLTMQLPTEDRYAVSRTFAQNQIAMLMGGRIAEELIFDELTTGAGNDIERATDLARKMVCEWGMSEKMGPLAFGSKEGEVFLGRDMMQASDYSERTAQEIDTEVRRIVNEQYARARKILEDNKELLHKMAEALLQYETIDDRDIHVLKDGGAITREKPVNRLKTREQLEAEREKKAKALPENKDAADSSDSSDSKGGPMIGALPEPGGA
jgi:cell division protease FtsH